MTKWQEVRLGDVCKFQNGKKRPKEPGKYPVFGGNGILDYTNQFNSNVGVIVGRVGAYCGSVFLSKEKCWVSDNAILGINTSDTDIIYLYYLLKSLNLNAKHIGSGQPLITQDILNNIKIFLPPLDVQKKIAGVLGALDDKIELNNKINNNLEQQAQALFKSWFVDFEPFGGTMPKDWKVGKLTDVLKLKKTPIKAGENLELPYLPIDIIPMHSLALTEFRPNSEAQSSLITFDKDDILIGAMRVYFHRVTIAPCAGITRTTCFVLSPFDESYLLYALLLCNQDKSIEFAQTTSKGSTMPYAVWEGGFGDLEINIPQRNIVEKFNNILLPSIRQIQNSYFENTRLEALRDALLPKLMSGEIDVSNVDISALTSTDKLSFRK